MARIICFLFLITGAVLFPLLFAVGFFVVFVSFFPRFWEGILAGVVLDSLYFSPILFSKFSLGFFTVGFIVTILFMEKIKRLIQGRNFISKLLVAALGAFFFSVIFLCIK